MNQFSRLKCDIWIDYVTVKFFPKKNYKTPLPVSHPLPAVTMAPDQNMPMLFGLSASKTVSFGFRNLWFISFFTFLKLDNLDISL